MADVEGYQRTGIAVRATASSSVPGRWYGCRRMSAHEELLRPASGEGTFLGRLPADARTLLLADATVIKTHHGRTVFSANESPDRVGIVLAGMVRSYLTASDGRRLSVRYARPGVMVGSITGDRAALGVQAVSDGAMLEIHWVMLQGLILTDGLVGLLLISEVAQRLKDTYATLAANTFGSMRERVASHLLDLAIEGPANGALGAATTQQGLADGVGTVREVVARTLRDFRDEGLVTTTPGHIEILDPDRLAGIIGR